MAKRLSGVLNAVVKYIARAVLPSGAIMMWNGTTAPAGWALCDGGTYTTLAGGSVTVPNLRDKFIVGAGTTYALGAVGGTTSQTPTINGTALTVAQLPAHNHGYSDPAHAHNNPYNTAGNLGYGSAALRNDGNGVFQGAVMIYANSTGGYGAGIGITIANNGGGAAHTHTANAISVLPPYYALSFIYKL